jgi:hypothetical protein
MSATTINQLLQQENARISYGDRWLVWSGGQWVVLSRRYGQKRTRELIATDSEAVAIAVLLNGDEVEGRVVG